ncbi:MAG TPA: sugar transferase [Armatimonadota bacterium]|nr:sugar transferase [Armatimonadota bacterium]
MQASRRAFERRHLLHLVLSDAASCVGAVVSAYGLRLITPELLRPQLQHPLTMYLWTLPVILPLWLATFEALGLYNISRVAQPFHDLTDSVRAVTLATLMIAAVSFLSRTDYSRGMLILFWVIALSLVSVGRTLLSNRRARALATGRAQAGTLIVGCGELGRIVLSRSREHPEFGHRIVGFVSANGGADEVEGMPVMGGLDDVPELVAEHAIEAVIVAQPGLKPGALLDVVSECEEHPVEFQVISGPFEVLTGQADINGLGDLPTIGLGHASFGSVEELLKRGCDILASSLGLLVLSPLILVVGVLIRRQTGDSAIFRQERVGLGGQPFTMYKFRSMRSDVEPYADAPAGEDDPRVTRIGAWLRKYSLDEVPQFWNIIKGDMSLVGPRPEMPYIVEQYEPWQRRRIEVRPGLTGLWQILGRKDLPLRDNIEYDFYYLTNRSLLLDLVIVYKTLGAVIRRRGAY